MNITVGSPAPDFNLPDTEKNMHSLNARKGKNVVLLFFPAAFTGVCTKEMCQTRDELTFYNSMNAEVLGISVDMHFSLAKFRESEKINFPLLSDFNKEAAKAYGVLFDQFAGVYNGVAKRASFVIDKNGTVRFAEILPSPGDFPSFDKIKATLEGLK
ncbi:MAG: redoxin domain-containing protein [Bacteroidia bacterium]|nr:redoxin domain-containing protein [Bacteroidia bacterium]